MGLDFYIKYLKALINKIKAHYNKMILDGDFKVENYI